MWHVLKAELAYFRAYLLGSLGLAVGVVAVVSGVFLAVGDRGPSPHEAAGIRAMFLIMAPMIVGFIVQGIRSTERRSRLLFMGPLSPRQLAGVMVLLPAVLCGIGALAAGLWVGVSALVTGKLDPEALNVVGFVGGQLVAYTQVALLVEEVVACHRQRRPRAAVAGWAVLVLAVLVLAVLYVLLILERLTWTHIIVGHLVVAPAVMAATIALYSRRTDFTR